MHIYRQVSESSNVVTFQEKGVPSNKPSKKQQTLFNCFTDKFNL